MLAEKTVKRFTGDKCLGTFEALKFLGSFRTWLAYHFTVRWLCGSPSKTTGKK